MPPTATKWQIPITKSQIPNNIQSPKTSESLEISVIGILFIGVWDLVLYISSKPFQKAK